MLQLKVCITALLLFATIASVTAQDTAKQQLKHQLGINTTAFVKEFLSFNTITTVADNPYLITYKYMMGGNTALRAGLGLRILSQKQSSTTTLNVPDSSLINYYLRIGYEKQFTLAKRWIGYAGCDIRWEHEKSVSKTTVVPSPTNQVSTITTKNLALGAGPVLGVEFIMTRRLSLSAEGALLYFYNEDKMTVEDSRYPSLTTSDFSARNNVAFSFPTTIYFIIKI